MPSLRSPLLREIGAIYRSIQSIMELRFRNKQLQRGQFIFLTRICEHPGIKQVELTRMCRVDKGTSQGCTQADGSRICSAQTRFP